MISASLDYRSFAWRAGLFDGVAIVRVTSVSDPTWNTPTGARPDEALLLAAMQEGTGTKYLVGRVLTVELVESLRGSWTPPTSLATLFVPGGELNGDSTSVSVPPLPTQGELGIAFTWEQPKTFASGLVSYIAEIYPVDGSERVITPLPSEDVTVDNIRSHLP